MQNHNEIQSRFKLLNAFFRSYYSFIKLSEKCGEFDTEHGELYPFTHLHNVLLCDTVINWCKIFGTYAEECHWKKVVIDHNEFREQLFEKIGKSSSDFFEYQQSMCEFRNTWVVHHDPKHKHKPVPFFKIAHDSAVALHTYLRTHSDKSFEYAGPKDIEEFGKNVANALFSKNVITW